jgi:outer membrane protein assembly factor BamB
MAMTRTFLLLALVAALWAACGEPTGTEQECEVCQHCTCPNCPACKCPEIVEPEVEEEPEPDLVAEDELSPEPEVQVEKLTIKATVASEVLSGIAEVSAKVEGGGSILGVEFYVDSQQLATDIIPPYNATVKTTDFPDGQHFVTVFTADDTDQNASDSITVTFDNTPPQIISVSPAEGDCLFFEDGPLHMSVEVDDPAAIKLVTLRANGQLIAELNSPPFAATAEYSSLFIDITSLPKNIYFQFQVEDYLGQKSEKATNVNVLKRLAWTFETVGEIWGTASLLPSGTIVFGNNDFKVYGVGPDGGLVWTYAADSQVIKKAAVDTGSGILYFGTTKGTVVALNQSGGQVWTKELGSPPAGDLAYANGNVYVPAYNGTIYCLNASNGGDNWQGNLPAYSMSGVTVDPDGTVYVGCQDHKLYAMSNGGGIKWSIPTGQEVWSTPTIGPDHTVYFGSNDGWLYAITYEGGSKWVKQLEGQIWGKPLLTDDGFLYVASTSKKVYKLVAAAGTDVWSAKTDGFTYSSPVLGPDGRIYVGTVGGSIVALHPDTGNLLWTYTVGNSIHATPLITSNRLYFGSTDRKFYSLWLGCY